MKAEKLICDFIHDFVMNHWDKIDLKKCEIKKSKQDFLKEVKSDVQTALWVLTEVCVWGMDNPHYLKDVYVEFNKPDNCNFDAIKIFCKHIKLHYINQKYSFAICKPKYKTVAYFD